MAPDHHHHQQEQEQPTTTGLQSHWQWNLRRRRRKVQTVRLGGQKPRRRVFRGLVRVFRKMRVKLQYLRLLKRLKEHYKNMVRDVIEGGAAIETFQQRLFMESTFAIPVGINLSSYPTRYGSDNPRTIFM